MGQRSGKTVRPFAVASLTALMLGASGAASGHEGASGIVLERMEAMTVMAKSVKTIKAALGNDAGAVRQAAQAIEQRAGVHMTALFPEGEHDGMSEAKPVIWTEWPEFTASAVALADAARSLAAEQTPAAFKALVSACGGCHAKFRAE